MSRYVRLSKYVAASPVRPIPAPIATPSTSDDDDAVDPRSCACLWDAGDACVRRFAPPCTSAPAVPGGRTADACRLLR